MKKLGIAITAMALMLAFVGFAGATKETAATAGVTDISLFNVPGSASFGFVAHDETKDLRDTIGVTQQGNSWYVNVYSDTVNGKLASVTASKFLTNVMEFDIQDTDGTWYTKSPVTSSAYVDLIGSSSGPLPPGAYSYNVAFKQTGDWHDFPADDYKMTLTYTLNLVP